jgi:hypothetical protein
MPDATGMSRRELLKTAALAAAASMGRTMGAAGESLPAPRNAVRFGIAGDGRLVDNLGTPDGSRVVELANGRARISVITQGGRSTISVSSKGLPAAFLTVA